MDRPRLSKANQWTRRIKNLCGRRHGLQEGTAPSSMMLPEDESRSWKGVDCYDHKHYVIEPKPLSPPLPDEGEGTPLRSLPDLKQRNDENALINRLPNELLSLIFLRCLPATSALAGGMSPSIFPPSGGVWLLGLAKHDDMARRIWDPSASNARGFSK
ncbi:hypothetical protein BD626DRAFT_571606 [Schizophyllum amplum]|uniref:Uncharacterized protein n=1 Tax=Schizophyllum amplum TaxID=97359 RepID=A0A550C747_9AGAR|nr:hypothetical protein BD626DRAFT_571606 [Auriculariopsis ampla]